MPQIPFFSHWNYCRLEAPFLAYPEIFKKKKNPTGSVFQTRASLIVGGKGTFAIRVEASGACAFHSCEPVADHVLSGPGTITLTNSLA